ncbi:MAG TPA: hypothetical protein VFD03_10845 [Clostridia bacterium]|nr:hypothetical protein [Clostridia bacterium]
MNDNSFDPTNSESFGIIISGIAVLPSSIFSKEEKIKQILELIRNPDVRPFVEQCLLEVIP